MDKSRFGLSFIVTGSGPTFQWYKNGIAIEGETSYTYRPSIIGLKTTDQIYCVATNICGSVQSNNVTVAMNHPSFMLTGSDGYLYICANGILWKNTLDGNVTVFAVMNMTSPYIWSTSGIDPLVQDSSGNIYCLSQNVLQKVTATGVVTPVWSSANGGESAWFSKLILASSGDFYFSNGDSSYVTKIVPATGVGTKPYYNSYTYGICESDTSGTDNIWFLDYFYNRCKALGLSDSHNGWIELSIESGHSLFDLIEGADGKLYYTSNQGIGVIDTIAATVAKFCEDTSSSAWQFMEQDSLGNLWTTALGASSIEELRKVDLSGTISTIHTSALSTRATCVHKNGSIVYLCYPNEGDYGQIVEVTV